MISVCLMLYCSLCSMKERTVCINEGKICILDGSGGSATVMPDWKSLPSPTCKITKIDYRIQIVQLLCGV